VTDQAAIRERYMHDTPPVRLGNLAANLARIQSFSDNPDHRDIVESLLEESAFFIEWTAQELELDTCVALVELQRLLVHWRHTWSIVRADPSLRSEIANQAQAWSRRVLRMAGFLPEEE
jgi:hypothetical protein